MFDYSNINQMKQLLFCLLMTCGLLHSQEAYIVTTTGDTISIDAGESFYDTGRKIKYYSGNAIFPKTIKTEEVYEIIDGKSYYAVFTFSGKSQLYKLVATSPRRTLWVRFIEPAANSSSGGLGMEYYVVGMANNVIASGEVSLSSSKKKAKQEKQATKDILEHFSECTAVTENLGKRITVQRDGTENPFDNNLPLGFKMQKGILNCD